MPNSPLPTVLCIVGARPNFMKIAPIMRALAASTRLNGVLVHTGQHYDAGMSDSFFADLGIPRPDHNLEVGSASHAQQTAAIMTRFEPVLEDVAPACVLVVGDVNSTIACALVAAKKGVPVAHVEAGLRSYDRTMPEEINRVLTDQISDFLFTTEKEAEANLASEGIAQEKVFFTGNVMIDTLKTNQERAGTGADALDALGLSFDGAPYGLLTLHRPSNVDDAAVLTPLLEELAQVANDWPLVFPVHPRTRKQIEAAGLAGLIENSAIHMVEPLGYLSMLALMADAHLILTDSGGIQEEATALGVPCFTLRDNTERPITLHEGTNTLVGTAPEAIRAAITDLKKTGGRKGRVPELWDGQAAGRIVAVLEDRLA